MPTLQLLRIQPQTRPNRAHQIKHMIPTKDLRPQRRHRRAQMRDQPLPSRIPLSWTRLRKCIFSEQACLQDYTADQIDQTLFVAGQYWLVRTVCSGGFEPFAEEDGAFEVAHRVLDGPSDCLGLGDEFDAEADGH